MEKKERFHAVIAREPADRPAGWLGLPVPEAESGLLAYFRAKNMEELKYLLDDDVFPVSMPYSSPSSSAIETALDFSMEKKSERTLTAPGFFEGYSDPGRIGDFPWPEPSKHIDSAECLRAVDSAPDDYPVLGVIWSAHFQDACSAFGMETALVKMKLEPGMFRAVIGRIVEFYLEANEIFYSAAGGKLDAVLIGNDFGSQTGLMLSPDLLREFVFPGTKSLVRQAKDYGLKVFHHSCGAIAEVIPDLIEMGVDVIHPIQALASGMEPERLMKDFGDSVSFCGGVDAQQLLVNGSPGDVADKVEQLKKLFPTGLIISPSHEAILPDISPANIEALFLSLNR